MKFNLNSLSGTSVVNRRGYALTGYLLEMTAALRCLVRGVTVCILSGICLAMSGCAVDPPSVIKTKLTTTPQARMGTANNGAIFQTSAYRPLFEDRRARFIGDTMTIEISETTSAAKSAAGSSSKTGTVASSIGAFANRTVPSATMAGSSSLKNADADSVNSSNTFTGTIGVTVIDVLSNNNLVVSGEKQVALDRGTEFVRFYGVVNPDDIAQGNTVASTKVADARVEYRTNSHIDAAQLVSLLSRFFLSMAPL